MPSRNRIPKLLFAALSAALLSSGVSTGYAQKVESTDSLEHIRPLLAEADSAMEAIERELSRIEGKRQIEDAGSILDTNFDKAAQASDRALTVLHTAAKNDSMRSLNINLGAVLSEFEKTALSQRERAVAILRKVSDTQQMVQQGSVLISVKLFDDASLEERAAFLKSLSPATQETYKRLAPDRFSGVGIRLYGLSDTVRKVVQSGLDACVPEAKAALAIGCLSICSPPTPACYGCLVATLGTAAVLVKYVSCKATCGSCKWYRPWSCACQAACYTAMVAVIADNSLRRTHTAIGLLNANEK
jgi:hypothetical protein